MTSQVTRRRTIDATAKTTRRKLTAAEAATKVETPKVTAPSVPTPASMLPTADTVLTTVPVPFKLTIDHHHDVAYPAGTVRMPREHAEHWWAKANGVTIAK